MKIDWKNQYDGWKKRKNNLMFLLGLFLGILGINIFSIGFHNFDSAQNMIFIRDDITIDLLRADVDFDINPYMEQFLNGKLISLEDTYVLGLKQINSGIVLAIVGFFVAGYYFKVISS